MLLCYHQQLVDAYYSKQPTLDHWPTTEPGLCVKTPVRLWVAPLPSLPSRKKKKSSLSHRVQKSPWKDVCYSNANAIKSIFFSQKFLTYPWLTRFSLWWHILHHCKRYFSHRNSFHQAEQFTMCSKLCNNINNRGPHWFQNLWCVANNATTLNNGGPHWFQNCMYVRYFSYSNAFACPSVTDFLKNILFSQMTQYLVSHHLNGNWMYW